MLDVLVMKVVGFKLAVDTAIRKLVNTLLSVSKKMLKAWLRVQINVVVFPLCFMYGGFKCVYQHYASYTNEVEATVEPESSVIVGAVKELRNSMLLGISSVGSPQCNGKISYKAPRRNSVSISQQTLPVCMGDNVETSTAEEASTAEKSKARKVAQLSLTQFSGTDIMWDIPIISEKAKYFAKCLKEGNPEKIAAAKKALEEHPADNPVPKTRTEYDRLMEEAKNGPPRSKETVLKFIDSIGVEKPSFIDNSLSATCSPEFFKSRQKNKKVNFRLDGVECSSSREGVAKCHNDFQLTIQNKILRRRLAATNSKLEEVHKACSNLLHGIKSLNEHFNKFTCMREKLVTLESELDDGRKLLHEVEADRNDMRSKLLALAKLIKEEEDYLDDISCESGFDETENNGDSHDEL